MWFEEKLWKDNNCCWVEENTPWGTGREREMEGEGEWEKKGGRRWKNSAQTGILWFCAMAVKEKLITLLLTLFGQSILCLADGWGWTGVYHSIILVLWIHSVCDPRAEFNLMAEKTHERKMWLREENLDLKDIFIISCADYYRTTDG